MNQDLYLKQLELGPMQNFIYLIGDSAKREAIVIDPGWEPVHLLETLGEDGYQLVAAFATHHHFDHVTGLGRLLEEVDIPVYAHEEDVNEIHIEPGSLRPTKDGQTIQVGNMSYQCLHTPGHTPGSQCYLIDGRLFTGDTMFINACGRWDLPGGDVSKLYDSLVKKLKLLPDDTVVFPGHNYAPKPTSTIAQEKQSNPFLQPESLQQFLRLAGMG